jgi:hypothetical protein
LFRKLLVKLNNLVMLLDANAARTRFRHVRWIQTAPARFPTLRALISTPNRRTADKRRNDRAPGLYSVRGTRMAFEIVAEKESETVRMSRSSSLIAIAKARVWASEGWNVTIVVSDEDAAEFAEGFAPSLAYM